ncbi:MAG: phosphoadenylyl-sulfate reductase, partial [Alphaproteobacteria bacterium]|nr:phosphoadenylyl-sulfate reductase [Alphaproteobacteria bacterium]
MTELVLHRSRPALHATDQATNHKGADLVAPLNESFAGADLFQRLAGARRSIEGPIVFTTSFGIEDQAITHAIFDQELAIEVTTLDTGRLFTETCEVWAATERRYGVRIRGHFPERDAVEALTARDGIAGFRSSIAARQDCCAVRKVEPLGRALKGAAAWITGLRATQSHDRAATRFAEIDAGRGLIKLNPLADWSREDVVAFVAQHHVPYNVLHDRGFPSIGCAPCTRAVAPG